LLAGDIIAKIDGADTVGLSVEQAVRKIRGEKGTQVVLSIYRSKASKPIFDVTITRDIIRIVSVKSKLLEGGIAYIEMSSFNADTGERFARALDELLRQKPTALILDVRNNPGGLLDQAQRVAGAWVGERVVVKERRQGKIFEELRGLGRARLAGMPTVVLINQGSATLRECRRLRS
jgi:carboxyl-terminal processing protease